MGRVAGGVGLKIGASDQIPFPIVFRACEDAGDDIRYFRRWQEFHRSRAPAAAFVNHLYVRGGCDHALFAWASIVAGRNAKADVAHVKGCLLRLSDSDGDSL